ncbi:MAG: ArsA-related P-loop ATPase [Myxococcota bacterium]|jgi:anion-transporting  ArsA/GET3 family ATPase|nr:ArsA-related P-loop ATPase [Myxococcota bacterium]
MSANTSDKTLGEQAKRPMDTNSGEQAKRPINKKSPRVIVCAGGGGVGKTTTSAALGMALARSGQRTMLVTIDPARRLADALQVPLGSTLHTIELGQDSGGYLDALMPEPESASRAFMADLFAEQPDGLERLQQNKLFMALEDKLAGMAELVAMGLLMRAVEAKPYDFVVIDTAPSRFALDFLTYPARLSQLIEGRALRWLAGMVLRLDEEQPQAEQQLGLTGWGRRKVEGIVAHVIGASLLKDTAHLFAEFFRIRKRFARITARLGELLLGPKSDYVVVAAPTGAAEADAAYIFTRLEDIRVQARGLLLNRASMPEAEWEALSKEGPEVLRRAASRLGEEKRLREAAAQLMIGRLRREHRELSIITLPKLEAIEPRQIVSRLAEVLSPQLETLLGPLTEAAAE